MGLSRATPAKIKTEVDIARLWYHECERVIGDRLTTDDDQAKFKEMINATNKKWFADIKVTFPPPLPSLSSLLLVQF